jgi:hypothetical protein
LIPLLAFALVWTTTAAGPALFRIGYHPAATVLAAAAAGLGFDLAGRRPGRGGPRLAAAAGPGSTAPTHQPPDPVRLNPTATLGCRAGHHVGAAAPIQHYQRDPIDDRG